MLCREVLEKIQEDYPVEAALDWDHVGLVVGRYEKEVHRIHVAVDATEAVIQEAIDGGADLLITHHPLLFDGVYQVNDGDFLGRRILSLAQADLCCYAMHTNYDCLRMADLAVEKLELAPGQILEVTQTQPKEIGIGRVTDVPGEMTLAAFAGQVKDVFHLPDVRIFGSLDQVIHRMAIVPGSGKSEIPCAVSAGADVLVTGDIGHHDGIDAVAKGCAVIDAGHYGIEHIFIQDMARYMAKKLPGMQVTTAAISHPFAVL